MKDKEKQIEEMAKIILYCPYSDTDMQARRLYDNHCRIIDKDSVVILKSEYKKLYDEERASYYRAENLEIENRSLLLQLKDKGKETAEKIYKMGEEFYKMTYRKNNALPRLLEWIKETFGIGIKE